jgi:hypothetical protein
VLANELVEEGRLAHVGGAGEGDVAGLGWHASQDKAERLLAMGYGLRRSLRSMRLHPRSFTG